jgi:hypothetical protein
MSVMLRVSSAGSADARPRLQPLGPRQFGTAIICMLVASAARVQGAANGSSTWESQDTVLPEGWHSARLDSGEEFFFRQDDPEQIFWEVPVGSAGADPGAVHTMTDTSASHDTTGAAIARQGEVLGEIELCDAGERIGDHGYDGLLAFMKKHGFHYINKHPQRHMRDLHYRKGRCQKGHNEPHIKFVEKTDRGALVEEMKLHGKTAGDILRELKLRGIDASVQHAVEPRKPRQGKWGPDGKKLAPTGAGGSGGAANGDDKEL